MYNILHGQVSLLHGNVSVVFEKSQGRPSGSGDGLLQTRDRVLTPPLHDAEHSEKSDHTLHPPCTKMIQTSLFKVNKTGIKK